MTKGPPRCPQMLDNNDPVMRRNIVEERRHRLYRCEILKCRTSLQYRDRGTANDKAGGYYNGQWYLLTPWSRVLLEKLTGFAANQEIPRILCNPKVYYRTRKRPPRPVVCYVNNYSIILQVR